MERKGVEREMAKCVSCNVVNTLTPFVPMAAQQKFNSEQTVKSGSFVDLSKESEVGMSKKQVEKTNLVTEEVVTTAAVEETAQEEVVEFEQEIEIPVTDLAEAISRDGDALRTLALALVREPLFIQELGDALGGQVEVSHILEVQEALPLRAKFVFTGSGQKSGTVEQVAQPVNRPVAVRQAAAAPVALPQQNGVAQKRKPSVLDLLPPSK
jgi:hypothetical protein